VASEKKVRGGDYSKCPNVELAKAELGKVELDKVELDNATV
jgi:hypothetical protein